MLSYSPEVSHETENKLPPSIEQADKKLNAKILGVSDTIPPSANAISLGASMIEDSNLAIREQVPGTEELESSFINGLPPHLTEQLEITHVIHTSGECEDDLMG